MSLRKILSSEGIVSIDHGYEHPRSGGTGVMQDLVQDLKIEQGLERTAMFDIPQRVKDAAEDFDMMLGDAGLRGHVKAFNSGNIGVLIDCEVGKFIYLDQPGVVGAEDQSEGFVAFGHSPMSDPRKGLFYFKHHARKFGDVNLTRLEWETCWREIMFKFEDLLPEPG